MGANYDATVWGDRTKHTIKTFLAKYGFNCVKFNKVNSEAFKYSNSWYSDKNGRYCEIVTNEGKVYFYEKLNEVFNSKI